MDRCISAPGWPILDFQKPKFIRILCPTSWEPFEVWKRLFFWLKKQEKPKIWTNLAPQGSKWGNFSFTWGVKNGLELFQKHDLARSSYVCPPSRPSVKSIFVLALDNLTLLLLWSMISQKLKVFESCNFDILREFTHVSPHDNVNVEAIPTRSTPWPVSLLNQTQPA